MRVVPKAVREGVVAVIRDRTRLLITLMLLLSALLPLLAAVLPEDRFDALYHAYEGGGVQVNGPSILLRKQISKNSSLSANYYVDSITSASVDVITSASPYSERREEKSIGADFLIDSSTLSVGFSNSEENDFSAKTAAFSVSNDFFGDLTTLSLGYIRGWDDVGKTGDPLFGEHADRQRYRIGLSQIVSKEMIVALNFETVTDEGYLNNPYRSVRYLDPASAKGYSFEPEVYPRTRTSNALAIRGRYALPYRASAFAEYRYYSDSWGIEAQNIAFGYTHAYRQDWLFDLRYRYYSQGRADFFSDLFPHRQAQNFLARDKELSAFANHSFGISASYLFQTRDWPLIDRGSLNLSLDHILFNYDEFRDINSGGSVGAESLYSFSANVLQLYLSVWY